MLTPEFAGKPFVTVEGTELPVEVAIPVTLPQPLKAELVIEGNGGSKRVVVVLGVKPDATDPARTGRESGPEADGLPPA